MKRWLGGLLCIGMVLVVMRGRGHGKAGVGTPPPAVVTAPQVHVAPFSTPATMPALGEELARGLYAALRDANIPARLGKGDEGSAIVGRLEEISQAQVRLQASYHGHSVQSVGDLEHLDDLVYAVFTQLRPRLQAADTRSGALDPPSPAVPGVALPGSPAEVRPSATKTALVPKPPTKEAASPEPLRLASVKESLTRPSRSSTPSTRPVETLPKLPAAIAAHADKEPVVPSTPATLPPPPPVNPEPVAEPRPPVAPPVAIKNPSPPRPAAGPYAFDSHRPRVAVHVVGEPVVRIPAGYSGLGAIGQQSLMSYLQQRLRIPAVASRLVGLTGGLMALDQSLRVGARHTLMVRLDGLTLAASPASGPMPGPMGGGYPGGTLSGRIHIVLLLDGKLLFDRSVMLPPTLVLPSDSPAQAYTRSLVAAMDAVASELSGRITDTGPGSNLTGAARLP